MNRSCVLQGHTDSRAFSDGDLSDWNADVHFWKSVLRFRRRLSRHPKREAIRKVMAARPKIKRDEGRLFVHGSPRIEQDEYIFPETVHDHRRIESIAEAFGDLCCCGHTHIPGLFRRDAQSEWQYEAADAGVYRLSDKLICNVGSVGQPRDGDHRACYVLLDGNVIVFRRIEYDIELTIKKVKDDNDDDGIPGEPIRRWP